MFRGTLANGMLTGRGGYFTFDAAGAPVDDVRSFEGDFSCGVLHGAGRKTWTWAATARPSAQVLEGQFNQGTPVGDVRLSLLRPSPGVEAESELVAVDADGRPLLVQPNATAPSSSPMIRSSGTPASSRSTGTGRWGRPPSTGGRAPPAWGTRW